MKNLLNNIVITPEIKFVIQTLFKFSKNSFYDKQFQQQAQVFQLIQDFLTFLKSCSDEDNPPLTEQIYLLGTIKNISAIFPEDCRQFTIYLIDFIPEPHEQVIAKKGQLFVQLTGILRNLCVTSFFKQQENSSLIQGIIKKLKHLIEKYALHQECMYNTVRFLSKVSLDFEYCRIINEDHEYLEHLIQIMGYHTSFKNILTRVAFILSNVTTNFEESRLIIGIEFNGLSQTIQNIESFIN